MTEKRYRSNKYIHCYCEKDEDVLVGIKVYRFVNVLFVIPVSIALCVMLIAGWTTSAVMTKVGMMGLILFPALLSRIAYSRAKEEMRKDGHTKLCSRKISYLAMLYDGPWSDFKIMKDKEN